MQTDRDYVLTFCEIVTLNFQSIARCYTLNLKVLCLRQYVYSRSVFYNTKPNSYSNTVGSRWKL